MQGLEMLIVLLRNTTTDSSFTCQLVPVMSHIFFCILLLSHVVHSKIEIIIKNNALFSIFRLISATLSILSSLGEKWQVMEDILF